LLLERFAAAPARGRKRGRISTSLRPGGAARRTRSAKNTARRRTAGGLGVRPTEESFCVRCWPRSPIAWRAAESAARPRGNGRGRGLRLGAESVVHTAELFVCIDVEGGRRGERAESLVRQASGIEESWLADTMLHTGSDVVFDEKLGRVTGTARRTYRDLALSEKSVTPPLEQASALLAVHAGAAPSRALDLDDEDVQGFLARVGSLSVWMPELALPTFDDEALAEVAREIAQGRRSFEEMRRVPLSRRARGTAFTANGALREHAPESLTVPSGNHIRLRYESGRPVLRRAFKSCSNAREPARGGGRVPVVVHLLAPNGRPATGHGRSRELFGAPRTARFAKSSGALPQAFLAEDL
jgi:hypothetical protein